MGGCVASYISKDIGESHAKKVRTNKGEPVDIMGS
jgi:hypothetical protein